MRSGLSTTSKCTGRVPARLVERNRYRHHLRLGPELPADRRLPVLGKGADFFGGVHDLERVQGRGQRGDDLRLGHGNGKGAGLGDGVAAGQQLMLIHIGCGAGGSDLHVAPH